MDWSEVRRHNRKASARKAKRERAEAERKARVKRAGGVVAVGELRSAVREVRACRDTFWQKDFAAEVWTLRGSEWRLDMLPCFDSPVLVPHNPYREFCDHTKSVPLTSGAAKWVLAEWAKATDAA